MAQEPRQLSPLAYAKLEHLRVMAPVNPIGHLHPSNQLKNGYRVDIFPPGNPLSCNKLLCHHAPTRISFRLCRALKSSMILAQASTQRHALPARE